MQVRPYRCSEPLPLYLDIVGVLCKMARSVDHSGTSQSTSPSYSAPKLVARVCEESCERMQLVADFLLLKGHQASSSLNSKHLSVLEPLSIENQSYGKFRDTIIANTKALAISTKEFGQQMNLLNLGNIQKLADKVVKQVIILTETAVQAAYYCSLIDVRCKPAKPGVVDLYSFERAKQELHLVYEKFKPEYPLTTNEQILNISKIIADNLAILTRGCTMASENESVNPIDRAQFLNCSESLHGTTAAFLIALKTLASSCTEEHRKRCLLFGRPLLTAVDCIVEFSSFAQFLGKPAILTQKGHESQTDILGGAMAVISSSIQLLGTAKSILSEDESDKEKKIHRWQKLANCIKAVGDATKLLSSSIREHTPLPSRRPSSDFT